MKHSLDGKTDLCQLSARELTDGYQAGLISPVEATKAALGRAEAINPTLNAFVKIDPESALATAKASEERWRAGAPLSLIDGVPTTIKDIVRLEGWDVRYGSLAAEDVSALPDSPVSERLRKSGAPIIGLTTTTTKCSTKPTFAKSNRAISKTVGRANPGSFTTQSNSYFRPR